MRLIIVIPTYNERGNLASLIEQIDRYASGTDILIVDDNSPDGTGEAAEIFARQRQGFYVLHRDKKKGLGRAYVAGMKLALEKNYDVILQMDADLSHDPRYIPIFLDKIASYDLVIGSRYVNGTRVLNWDIKRLLLSKWATRYIQLVTGMPFTDATGGFNCWRGETLKAIGIDDVFSNGYLFQTELKYKSYRKKLAAIEIPIVFAERQLGKSKLDWRVIWEALWGVVKLRVKY